MSRNLSPSARAALYAPQTDDAFILLLTLSHPSLEQPIRVCSDAVDTTSRGDTFTAYPFDLTLPEDEEGRSPRARLVIDNVDRMIVAALRAIATTPTLKIEIIRAADPDTAEAVFEDFRLTNLRYDSLKIEADLGIEDYTAEPYPAGIFSPSLFPGLF